MVDKLLRKGERHDNCCCPANRICVWLRCSGVDLATPACGIPETTSRTIWQVLIKDGDWLAPGAFSASLVVVEAGRGWLKGHGPERRRDRLFSFAAAAPY